MLADLSSLGVTATDEDPQETLLAIVAEREAAARARGFQEGQSAAREAASKDLETERKSFVDERQRLLAGYNDQVAALGADMDRLIAAIQEEIVEALGKQVADLLEQVLEDRIRDQAMTDLKAVLSDLLGAHGAVRIIAEGPESLLADLSRDERFENLMLQSGKTDGLDLVVAVDQTLVATRLGAWAAALADDAS